MARPHQLETRCGVRPSSGRAAGEVRSLRHNKRRLPSRPRQPRQLGPYSRQHAAPGDEGGVARDAELGLSTTGGPALERVFFGLASTTLGAWAVALPGKEKGRKRGRDLILVDGNLTVA